MKCLKLTNTKDCLKLAKCLIGSENYYSDYSLKNIDRVSYKSVLQGVSLAGNFLVDSAEHGTEFEMEIVLPIKSIQVNPLRAMEYQVPIVADFKINYPNEKGEMCIELISHDGVIFKAEQDHDTFNFCMAWSECGMEDWDEVEQWIEAETIRLDYKELPEGAEVIEIDV